MLKIIINSNKYYNDRILSLIENIAYDSNIYKVSGDGEILKKDKHDCDLSEESSETYVNHGVLLVRHKGLTRYSDKPIKLKNKIYKRLTKNIEIDNEFLAIRVELSLDDIINKSESNERHMIDENVCIFIKKIYEIINPKAQGSISDFFNIERFQIFKIVVENEDLSLSYYYEFQCLDLFYYPWYVDGNISDLNNTIWNFASQYVSSILKERIFSRTIEDFDYYIQICKLRNY